MGQAKRALLLIDVQSPFHNVIQEANPHFADNIVRLLELARSAGHEIIHIHANYTKDCSAWIPVWDEMNSKSGKGCMGEVTPDSVCSFAAPRAGEHRIPKPTFDGFLQTNLESVLRQLEVTEVYVAGMVTSCCVLFTASGAFLRGFKVTLLSDCCADRTQEKQQHVFDVYGSYMFRIATLDDYFHSME